MSLQTEFEFTLPRGYIDQEGNLHRKGVMRLATAMDEIAPLRDLRVRTNQAYLVIILLSTGDRQTWEPAASHYGCDGEFVCGRPGVFASLLPPDQ